MAPGDVAHVPRTPSPVAGASLVAKHFRSRARLRRLLVRLRRPTPSTPALRATPGGASLTTFGFVTTVPRYLPVASNSLTCVRGADRAYCAPRKWLWRPTFALQKLAAARPPEGHWRAHPAAAPCRRTRQRYLAARRTYCAPCKRFCRPTDAQPVLAARTPPGGALACVPGSGTLPPALCRCCFGKKFVHRYKTCSICRGVWREVPEYFPADKQQKYVCPPTCGTVTTFGIAAPTRERPNK